MAPNLWAGGLAVLAALAGPAAVKAQKPAVDVGAVRAHAESLHQARSDTGAKAAPETAAAAPQLAAPAARPKATPTRAPAVQPPKAKPAAPPKPDDAPAADSTADPTRSDVLRETFSYGGAQRDPFASLIKTARVGPELTDLQLVGIYEDLRYSGNSIAVLREKTSGKRHKLRAGDQIGRLRVTQIRAKDVVFTVQDFGYERQETLSLRKQEDVTP